MKTDDRNEEFEEIIDDGHDKKSEIEDDVEFDFEDEDNSQIGKLKKKLEVCKREKEEYLLGWQRAQADAINQARRTAEDIKRIGERSQEELLEDILPVLDSFSMAFSNKEAWEKVDDSWRKGVEYIHDQLLKVLNEYGIEEIEVREGDSLSHELHHPLKTVPTDDLSQDDTIVSVIQKGYRIKGRVLRPAKVSVYKHET